MEVYFLCRMRQKIDDAYGRKLEVELVHNRKEERQRRFSEFCNFSGVGEIHNVGFLMLALTHVQRCIRAR